MFVYCIQQEEWLRKTFPSVTFANDNVLEKRFCVCLEEEEISIIPE